MSKRSNKYIDEQGNPIQLVDNKPHVVKVPIGGKLWGGSGMCLETYLALACQACIRESVNVEYTSYIKYSDINSDEMCALTCEHKPKKWDSIRKTIKRMSDKGKGAYNPVGIIKLRHEDISRFSTWVKLDFSPNKRGGLSYAVVPIHAIPKILQICATPMELDIYLTILGLTQQSPEEYKPITCETFGKYFVDYHPDRIKVSLKRLIINGLIEERDNVARYDSKLGHPIIRRGLKASNIDEWLDNKYKPASKVVDEASHIG